MNKKATLVHLNPVRTSAMVVAAGALLGVLSGGVVSAAGMRHEPPGPVPVTTMKENPKVPFKYALGVQKYRDRCSSCHGLWAEGVADVGPPLVHAYYRPDHHPDEAFYRATMKGVRSHHWTFGDMPPVSGITRMEVAAILKFVRWWQEQNGIR